MSKGQSSALLLLIVIMIFAGMIVFLFQLTETVTSSKYTNMFINNLLITMMRTDTGLTEPKCKRVSDLVFCAYFDPGWRCGDMDCFSFAEQTMDHYISMFSEENLRYLLIVETPGFIARSQSGEPVRLEIGDSKLKEEKGKTFSEPLTLQKIINGRNYILSVKLIVKKKK